MFFRTLAVAAAIGSAVAQRPSDMSICDYYTTALLKNNTAANQMTLLTLVVNTAVIGNYTTPNMNAVPGILAPGMVNNTAVNLLPYFSGGLASTNTGGSVGKSVNFLDGGGAAPLKMNMAANSTDSNQYILLTHLYEYFGVLLGCSMQGNDAYPAYDGDASLYEVHKFMDLSYAEVTYFIDQVALSAMSFGVAQDDLTAVGTALFSTFGYRCEPPMTVVPAQGPQLQSICIDDTCPLSPNATCSSYNATMKPVPTANGTTPSGGNSTSTGTQTSSGSGTATGSSPATASTAGAATYGMSFAAVAGGVAAMFL